MHQFVYFVPGFPRAVAEPAELDKLGLGHVHDGLQTKAMRSRFGPEEGLFVGVIDNAVPDGFASELLYKPAAQSWRDGPMVDGKPAYRVGYWTDSRPTPAGLVRRRPVGGQSVTLLDGQAWQIPVAMARDGLLTLPLVMDLDAGGAWVGRVSPQYRYLCEHAKTAYDWLMNVFLGRGSTIPFNDAMRVVVAALGSNYRIGPVETAMLGLVGDQEIGDIFEVLCDWASFREAMLKRVGEFRAGDSSGTSSGATENSPATSSPGA